MAKILKDDFRAGTFINQVSADWFNTVARRLNNIFIQNGEAVITERDITLYPDLYSSSASANWRKSFDINCKSQEAGTKPIITIAQGYINIQGETPVLVAETDIELERYPVTADATYIYLEMPDGGSAQVLKQIQGVRPKSVPGTWRKILYELYVDANDYPVITWDRRLDFDIGSPI